MKVIALMPVKNEAWILDYTLTCLKDFVDEIIVLEDGSTDSTKDILLKHPVTVINTPFNGFGSMRKELLRAGREHGGTHFVWLDADEVFTADLREDFRDLLKSMELGQKIQLRWLAMWKSPFVFRDDESVWSNNFKDFIFCDDGVSNFDETWIHEARTPGENKQSNTIKIETYGGVMHYQFVPWQRFQLKQAWYRCSELIKYPNTEGAINGTYSITLDDPTARCSPVRTNWLYDRGIPRNIEDLTSNWHQDSINAYFDTYGAKYFENLDIWHIKLLRDEFFEREGRYPVSRTSNRKYLKDVLKKFSLDSILKKYR
jgi:glycosyltransferase involved in cell wall biosynthesis